MNPKRTSGSAVAYAGQFFRFLLTVLGILIILFGCSGRLSWGSAWVYLGLFVVGYALNAAIILPRDPKLIAEHRRGTERINYWEKAIAILLTVLTVALLATAGLQVRFEWPPSIPLWTQIAGLFAMLLGTSLTSWALYSNPYFTTNVYFSNGCEYAISSSGPYSHLRHPGYAGLVMSVLATPLLLGTAWALIPAAVIAGLYVVYTYLEDQTLFVELKGYVHYAQQVRYRLLPGIW